MLSLLAGLFLLGMPLVTASPQAPDPGTTSYSFTNTEFPSTTVCNTISGTLSGPLASVPLSTVTSRPTSLSTYTVTVPETITTTESAPPYTATIVTTYTDYTTHSFDTLTSTIYSLVTSTVATATSTSTLCGNGGGSPTATSTIYTGTFVNPNPPSGSIFPLSVDCTAIISTLYTVFSTLSTGTTTSTIYSTPLPPPIAYSTSTYTQTIFSYYTAGVVTTTTTQTALTAAITTTTASVASCAAEGTQTVTYAAACAPTNLVGSVANSNGSLTGIYEYQDGDNTGSALTGGSDPSACCQLCQDNVNGGCAASASSPEAGNCELLFVDPSKVSGGTCGGAVGLRFEAGPQGEEGVGAPGNGFVVQGGCGIVEPVASGSGSS